MKSSVCHSRVSGADLTWGQRLADPVERVDHQRLGDPGALIVAVNSRCWQSFRRDSLAERQSMGAELLALPGKPVTTEAFAHLMLTAANACVADFGAAGLAGAGHRAGRPGGDGRRLGLAPSPS